MGASSIRASNQQQRVSTAAQDETSMNHCFVARFCGSKKPCSDGELITRILAMGNGASQADEASQADGCCLLVVSRKRRSVIPI